MSYKILDSFSLKIRTVEHKYSRNLTYFDYELSRMWENHRNLVKNQGMTTTLLNLVEKRLENITQRWTMIYNYRMNYYVKNSYDQKSSTVSKQNLQSISVSSNLILTHKHSMTDKQLQLLNRGPSYVPLCQSYVSLSSAGATTKSLDDLVKTFYAPFKHQLTHLFAKYHINIALSMEIQKKSYDLFKDLFSMPLPSYLQQRALYERQLIHSIRSCLTANDLILQRTADHMNTFCVMHRQDFERRIARYLAMSEDYKCILNPTENQSNPSTTKNYQNDLKDMIESMNLLLESLKNHKSIDKDTYNKLLIDPRKVKLPYIYFLPDISQVKIAF